MIPLPAIAACTPANVAPQTVAAVVQVESGGDALAVHINFSDGTGVVFVPQNVAQGVAAAAAAIQQGDTVDIGLMQVNSTNIAKLGYTLSQMFDPCTNIKVGATILSTDYAGALAIAPPGQPALRAALSAYNTGNYHTGFNNGYVAHYYGGTATSSPADPSNPFTASTTIFQRSTQNASFGATSTPAGHWPGPGG